ncbi:MAG: 3-deoxy-manno-octulosonate cytidylyltransferase [Syntrophobacterales bacterium]|nr:3-deoxy-manno-octulosonate cytidylyltransferase [Syntrophobacterales bacterium]
MSVVCIIPSRYESSRFPGKPLADLCGKPMVRHVYDRVLASPVVASAAVATDDERIYRAVVGFGGTAVMTAPRHRSGTDRVAEAASLLGLGDPDIVVNVQGDQPLFEPVQVQEVAQPLLEDPAVDMATLVYKIERKEEITHPNAVKVVFDRNHFALYFSRATIPYVRDKGLQASYYKHHGIYAYRKSFLDSFSRLEQTELERLEALEQLRALEHGYRIKVVETQYDSVEVDTPAELERVRQILMDGMQ